MHRMSSSERIVQPPSGLQSATSMGRSRRKGSVTSGRTAQSSPTVIGTFRRGSGLRLSDSLLTASTDFIQVHQKYIINMTYLIEVTGNQCHFFPPFDNIDYVKVGRLYRRKLIERFSCL